jgi:hypothetical protein
MSAAVCALSTQAAAEWVSCALAAGTACMGEGGCEPGSVRKVRATSAAVHCPSPAALPASATVTAAAAASPDTADGESRALPQGGMSLTLLHAHGASLPAAAWAAPRVVGAAAAALAGSGPSLGGMCRSTRGCWVREARRDDCICAHADSRMAEWLVRRSLAGQCRKPKTLH